jgi:gliding motility-associated-like protein
VFAKVNVNPNGIMYLGDSVTIHPGESYQIPARSNCNQFSWKPTYGVNDTNSSNPTVTPEVNTKYIVKGTTPEGCVVYDSISIRVDPGTIINVPNAFTPGTGVNNKLFIVKKGLATINSFRIYNRWGVTVFETRDINSGWDGTFNGAMQPFGVYVYDLEAVTEAGKIITKRGNVTLIR